MIHTLAYFWSLPYLRWEIIFVFVPTVLLWGFGWKYFLHYKKTIGMLFLGCLLWGIPLDILATPLFHIYFYPGKNLGFVLWGIPLEELVFLLFVPQAVVCILLLLRKGLYGKMGV